MEPEHAKRHQVISGTISDENGWIYQLCDAGPGSHDGTSIHVSKDGGETWADPWDGAPLPDFKDGGKGTPGHQVISAGTANEQQKNASIWFIDWGDNRCVGIYPKGTQAGLKKQDLGESDVMDADGKPYRAVQTLYSYKCGLAVKNVRSVVRVCNIDMAKIGSLTDANQKALIDKFVYAKNRLWQPRNPIAYVSGDLYSWLECYLTNKNNIHVTREEVMGAPPILRFGGIRVKKMDCMEDNEAAVTE